MNAKLLEERTVFHIATPARVERIRLATDFHMTPDTDFSRIDQLQPERFPAGRPLFRVCREHLLASQWMPVALDQPSGAFAGVSASGPSPEAVPQNPFHFLERPLRHNVTMVSVCSQRAREQPTALPILAGACQHLWLVGYDGAYGSSLALDFSFSLSLQPH